MAYYYLMAQLPSISSSSPAPITFDYFKELASRFLSKKQVKVLEELSLEPPREAKPTGSKFLDGWYESERALRLAMEQARASKLNWKSSVSPIEKEILSKNFSPTQVAKVATEMPNPLDAEIFLDNARFLNADSVKVGKHFSIDAVFSYGIKLLLRERAAKFEAQKGQQEYKATYDKILGKEAE